MEHKYIPSIAQSNHSNTLKSTKIPFILRPMAFPITNINLRSAYPLSSIRTINAYVKEHSKHIIINVNVMMDNSYKEYNAINVGFYVRSVKRALLIAHSLVLSLW